VNNALMHSPEDSTVGLRWWRTGDDLRAGLVIQIRNESETLLPRILEHISEQFQPGGQAPKTVNFRTGLGLLIVRALVREHGGELEIVSTPEFGTVAMVRLPSGPIFDSIRSLRQPPSQG
jgi:signal transduction histidine kinase